MMTRQSNVSTRAAGAAWVLAGAVCLAWSVTAEAGEFKLPDYEKFTLDNGLTVYLMEQHEVPMIYVSVLTPGGAIHDGTLSGLAFLTAEGLLFGTRNYTKAQIEEEMDFLGATLEARAGLETAGIKASFAVKDQDQVFPILKEVITAPTFDAQEFEKRKKRLLVELAQAKESPKQVIRNYYYRFLFGSHPYGNPVQGTPQGVESVQVQDLEAFYAAAYQPAGSAIAVVGDFDTETMRQVVTDLLGDWKASADPIKTPDLTRGIPRHRKSRVLLVDKDDALETTFIIGARGIARNNPDYIPLQVVNTILGGRFTSWLNSELRIKRGLTYGAYSGFVTNRVAGAFLVSSFTRTKTTYEAIDLALEVLDRLHTQGIDAETLESAKNYIKGQYPPRYETPGQLAGLLTSMFFYGYDESFINGFQETVDGMTVEKANAIIKKYFPKKGWQFVLIGKASEIGSRAGKYGKVIRKTITDEGY